MHARRGRTASRIAAGGLLAAWALAWTAPTLAAAPAARSSPASASDPACGAWTGVQPPDPGGTASATTLVGVAVRSPCYAWAVGDTSNSGMFQTLTEHWDGTAWTVVPSPNPAGPAHVRGVTAPSSGDAWIVGYYLSGGSAQTLIERWNGISWTIVPSPDPGGPGQDNILTGVAATSRTNVWAVGFYRVGQIARPLILHWDGSTWTQAPSPNPTTSDTSLAAVTATSASNAWAVGMYLNAAGTASSTLILHWNGQAWAHVPSPSPSTVANGLNAVAANSSGNAWAVGDYFFGGTTQTLTEHWNGHTWRHVPSPSPGAPGLISTLEGVTAISTGDAWAVGFYNTTTSGQTLVEHWNGNRWQQVIIPNLGQPRRGNEFRGISASSATSLWAVGSFFDGTTDQALALHCC